MCSGYTGIRLFGKRVSKTLLKRHYHLTFFPLFPSPTSHKINELTALVCVPLYIQNGGIMLICICPLRIKTGVLLIMNSFSMLIFFNHKKLYNNSGCFINFEPVSFSVFVGMCYLRINRKTVPRSNDTVFLFILGFQAPMGSLSPSFAFATLQKFGMAHYFKAPAIILQPRCCPRNRSRSSPRAHHRHRSTHPRWSIRLRLRDHSAP